MLQFSQQYVFSAHASLVRSDMQISKQVYTSFSWFDSLSLSYNVSSSDSRSVFVRNILVFFREPLNSDEVYNVKSKKSKAVPLHAMEALGGRGGIAPTHSRPRH
jgi:hypothetical protein